jgi:hypothetical protein
LNKYELLPDGIGVHWTGLDEHLSLRGFLLATMRDMLHQPTRLRTRTGTKATARSSGAHSQGRHQFLWTGK